VASGRHPTLEGFDPFAPGYLQDPQAALQDALRETPVFYHEPLRTFVVLRYADVRRVLTESDTFSADAFKAMPVPARLRERIPASLARAGELVIGGQLLNMDPPAHTRERKTAQRTFTRPRIEATMPLIERIANELIDDVIEAGSCDILQDFAYQLTLRVVGELLGLPDEVLPGFHAWIGDVFALMAPIDLDAEAVTTPDDELVGAYTRMHGAYETYIALVRERRRHPGDDLASAMLTLRDDDGRPVLSDDAVLAHMVGITAAGTDTTANLIAGMVRFLTRDPAALEALRRDPALWENAVEEGLRRSSISPHLFRFTRCETEVCGVTIPTAQMVCACTASANADPRQFPDPLAFDPRRPNAREHVGLGVGRHFCLGAPLARPQARAALRTLYERMPDLAADLDGELEFVPALTTRVVVSQRVSWTPSGERAS
jgi:hypothetical protein